MHGALSKLDILYDIYIYITIFILTVYILTLVYFSHFYITRSRFYFRDILVYLIYIHIYIDIRCLAYLEMVGCATYTSGAHPAPAIGSALEQKRQAHHNPTKWLASMSRLRAKVSQPRCPPAAKRKLLPLLLSSHCTPRLWEVCRCSQWKRP